MEFVSSWSPKSDTGRRVQSRATRRKQRRWIGRKTQAAQISWSTGERSRERALAIHPGQMSSDGRGKCEGANPCGDAQTNLTLTPCKRIWSHGHVNPSPSTDAAHSTRLPRTAPHQLRYMTHLLRFYPRCSQNPSSTIHAHASVRCLLLRP